MSGHTGPRNGTNSRLTRARIAAGMTQRELAERIGVHVNTLSLWERGKDPPASKLRALADALGTSINDLLEG